MRQELIRLLNRLLVTHAPSGQEAEMDTVIREELARSSLGDVQVDPHGNLYIVRAGRRRGRLTVITAHKDELSVVVRRIDSDGRIWVEPLGGSRPFKYGEGPFDLVLGQAVIEGVLCLGSTHSSDLSARTHRAVTQALTWDMVYIDCKLAGDELRAQGLRVGDRAVVGRRRKAPFYLQDRYVAGYALDDKAAVAVLLLLAQQLRGKRPAQDLCLAFTAAEEGGCSGGAYISRQLNPHDVIAVEIAPIADEYPTRMDECPVLLLKDAIYHYSADLADTLLAAASRCGIGCQTAVVRSFGSDASVSLKEGLAGRAACVCFATENTHGYEVAPLAALENCVGLLAEYVLRGAS